MVDVRPFGLDGSAGSTPLRITLARPGPSALFGKLYAATTSAPTAGTSWGAPSSTGGWRTSRPSPRVRRLVQYEDYLLRLMYAAGIPTAEPYGFVEITPEREYLIVTEFFEGAEEIGEADVDEEVIDDALAVVRRLWDVGAGPSRHQAGQRAGPGRARCCSSTWPSPRSGPRRGARPSTWPT